MKKYNLKRFLASLLAVLMLASVTGVSPAVFAAETAAPELVETSNDAPKEVLIKSNFTNEQVLTALAENLLTNAAQVNANDLSWTYTCAVKGTYKTSKHDPLPHDTKEAREANVSVFGKTYTDPKYVYGNLFSKDLTAEATYTYPALKDNTDGAYTLYLNDQPVYIKKVAKYSSSVDFTATDISVPFNNDGTIDYAQLKERIMEKVVTNPADIDRSSIVLTYEASPDLGKLSDVPGINQLGKKWKPIDGSSEKFLGFDVPYFAMNVGENKIKLSWAGDDTYYGFDKEFTVEFTDNRIATNIAIKENASITYNVDKDAMKKDIFNNVIDWAASTPTDKTALTYKNFKFEYKGKDLADAKLNADEKNPQDITISYSGDANSKPCNNVTASVIVKKANVKVSMNMFTKAYAGVEEDLSREALGVTLDPDDPNLDVYKVFTGINTNLETSVNLVLTDDQQAIINKISEIQIAMGEDESETLKAKLKEGIKISEVKDAINKVLKYCDNQAAEWLLDKLGLPSLDSIKNILFVLDKMTELFDDTKVCVGLPDHAGLYKAYAIAVNKNYNTGYASGTVLILMNVKNVKIVMNENFDKKMTVETAKEVAKAPALLQHNGVTVKDQSSLHYLYTGIQSNLKPYQSTTDFPTEPGRYVVTVVTLGGDYLASPVTRSFQITK